MRTIKPGPVGPSFNAGGGEHSCVYNGNAYYSEQLATSSGTVQAGSTAPTHTTGTVSDGQITWEYIGPVNTRLYLYGYTSLATKPPYKLQGFNIGARKSDILYVTLIDSANNSTPTTYAALLTPTGSTTPTDANYTDITTQQYIPGDPEHPLQYDAALDNWYVRVTAATSGSSTTVASTGHAGIHRHLGFDNFYTNSLFTGAAFLRRIPDNRSSRDRTYRVRYVVDSSASTLQRDPINGYILQPRNVPSGQSYDDVYYIYDIEKEQELRKSVQNGIYYMTVVKGSISPTDSNVSSFAFSQNINNLYPELDKDNPTEDPNAAVSVASNVTIGLVTTTNGSNTEDKALSISKEVIADYITETRNNYTNASTTDSAVAGFITLEARDGEAAEVDRELRMIPVNTTGGTEMELRRPSILRSGNHTFEYVGFGPGNYSTGLPSVQNRVLTDEETLLAQSQKEDGGIAFYSGLNSNGDLFIGNTKIGSVTGEEANLDTPTLSIVGETANLRPTFDEIIVRDKITVESATLESDFKGKLRVRGEAAVENTLTVNDLTIGGTNEAVKNIDVINTASPSASASANTGDWKLRENQTRGEYFGWYWTGADWVKMGLTDTGNMNISGGTGAADSTGDLNLVNGLGLNIQGTGTLAVGTGATTLGGTLSVTGNFSVNGTKFAVTASNGNVDTEGTLNVDGATTLNGNVTLGNLDSADNITITGRVSSNIIPDADVTYDLGSSGLKWNNVYASGFTASTFTGNLTGNVTGNVTGDLTGQADAADQVKTQSTNTNGSFVLTFVDSNNASATNETVYTDIGLLYNPSTNNLTTTTFTGSLSGTATNADNINVDEKNDNVNYQVLFSANNGSGYQRPYIDTDNGHLNWNPSTATLSGLNISASSVQATTFGTTSQNAYGARTVSTSAPSGGSNGDIWYRY